MFNRLLAWLAGAAQAPCIQALATYPAAVIELGSNITYLANMPKTSYMAFYTSRPFFAVSKVDFNVPRVEGWFYKQMAEEVFAADDNLASLRICRDGRVLIRIERLEFSRKTIDFSPDDDAVRRWGEYLDYLNAFYLLLDSAAIEVASLGYFNLHEITNRDAFRVLYEPGKFSNEEIKLESVASVLQTARFLHSYNSDVPIEFDSRICTRVIIPKDVIVHAERLFKLVVAQPGSEKQLSSLSKSLSEYKTGNYEIAIVLAWFIIEGAIILLWQQPIGAQGSSVFNKTKNKAITAKIPPISRIITSLHSIGVLDHSLFGKIEELRDYRNNIVHSNKFVPSSANAQLGIQTAQLLIERIWKIKFIPNLNYSVNGL